MGRKEFKEAFTNIKLSVLFNIETEIIAQTLYQCESYTPAICSNTASLQVSFMKRGNYSQYSVEMEKKKPQPTT